MSGFGFGDSGRRFGEERVEGGVLDEADLEANGNNLAEVGGGGEVFSACTEVGEAEMASAGEFEA